MPGSLRSNLSVGGWPFGSVSAVLLCGVLALRMRAVGLCRASGAVRRMRRVAPLPRTARRRSMRCLARHWRTSWPAPVGRSRSRSRLAHPWVRRPPRPRVGARRPAARPCEGNRGGGGRSLPESAFFVRGWQVRVTVAWLGVAGLRLPGNLASRGRCCGPVVTCSWGCSRALRGSLAVALAGVAVGGPLTQRRGAAAPGRRLSYSTSSSWVYCPLDNRDAAWWGERFSVLRGRPSLGRGDHQ